MCIDFFNLMDTVQRSTVFHTKLKISCIQAKMNGIIYKKGQTMCVVNKQSAYHMIKHVTNNDKLISIQKMLSWKIMYSTVKFTHKNFRNNK